MSVRKNSITARCIVNKLHLPKLEDKFELCLKFGKAIEQALFEVFIIGKIIIIIINCNWVVSRWQWLFYIYTKHEIGYY